MSIVIADLHFAYGSRVIFDGLSCRFGVGTMTALVGPSGSGKSTLISILLGQVKPNAGVVTVPGPVSRGGRLDPLKVAWVMQTANVFVRRSAVDNVMLSVACRGVDWRSAERRAEIALAKVGLSDRRHDRCGLMSGGERQRVAVARALAAETPVILADEPTVSLDAGNRDRLMASLDVAASEGATVIVATHDTAVVGVCSSTVDLRSHLGGSA